MVMSLNFDCDRKAKCDFTASTTNYLQNNGYVSSTTWYELDKYNRLVEFGSPSASTTARQDIYLKYGNKWFAIEIKERNLRSDKDFLIEEGSFMNKEKVESIMATGLIPIWAELYDDDIIRVWNLSKIDISSLSSTTKMIKGINIDPNSKKRMQKRLLLPYSQSKEYRRIRDDKQGDS